MAKVVAKVKGMAKKSVHEERAMLIDAQFAGVLTADGAARLAEIERQLDLVDGARAAAFRAQKALETAAIDQEIAALKSRIMIEKNAPRRPQAKTAGSH